MVGHRDRNLYKNELEKKVAFNIPLGLIFATIRSHLGVHFFYYFPFSGLPIWQKSVPKAKVTLGKPPALILIPFLDDFWFNFSCFWHPLLGFGFAMWLIRSRDHAVVRSIARSIVRSSARSTARYFVLGFFALGL